MKRLAWLLVLVVPAAVAQPITPFYLWEMTPELSDLSAQPSSTDLVNGWPETVDPVGVDNEMINESFYNGLFGIIDEENGVFSWLMNSFDGCLPLIEGQPSDGFLPGYGGTPTTFVDGQINGRLDGILRDYGRAALVMRFGFTNPTDIGAIRIIGGNVDKNGRSFQNYDVWASTEGLDDLGHYFLIAEGVRTGGFSRGNPGLWAGSLTEVHDFDSKMLAAGVTDLRVVFYCVDNTQNFFIDPWQGLANEDAGYQTNCAGTEEPEDEDGYRKAFVGPIIREIDVFAPGDITPWGDIDYDHDIDMVDAASFQLCYGGSTTAGGCFRFDFNEDQVINIDDFDTFAEMMTGPMQ